MPESEEAEKQRVAMELDFLEKGSKSWINEILQDLCKKQGIQLTILDETVNRPWKGCRDNSVRLVMDDVRAAMANSNIKEIDPTKFDPTDTHHPAVGPFHAIAEYVLRCRTKKKTNGKPTLRFLWKSVKPARFIPPGEKEAKEVLKFEFYHT
jgi:hypothetical protein